MFKDCASHDSSLMFLKKNTKLEKRVENDITKTRPIFRACTYVGEESVFAELSEAPEKFMSEKWRISSDRVCIGTYAEIR